MLLACAVGRRIRTALWPREEQEAMIDTVFRIVASGEASLREHLRVQVGCTRGAGWPPPFAQRGDRGRRHKRESIYYKHLSHATFSPQSPNPSLIQARELTLLCGRRLTVCDASARDLQKLVTCVGSARGLVPICVQQPGSTLACSLVVVTEPYQHAGTNRRCAAYRRDGLHSHRRRGGS